MKKYLLFCFLFLFSPYCFATGEIINDVTQINPIVVDRVIHPVEVSEIQDAIQNYSGQVSIGWGRFSMGGQIATEWALFIDMKTFNKILDFDLTGKTITIQPGISRYDIQKYVDPYDLSVMIMQTYNNFTVGGSLSVNVHGRYLGEWAIVSSVIAIKVVLADGSIVYASPTENTDIFYSAIWWYGWIGVIVEATLQLVDNSIIERSRELVPLTGYKQYFFDTIKTNTWVVFHNGDIYPPKYETVSAVTFSQTDKALTIDDRLISRDKSYVLNKIVWRIMSELPFGLWIREHILEPYYVYSSPQVTYRNYEASYDNKELEPFSRKYSTYVLQEYFVPVGKFDDFVVQMKDIFQTYNPNILNISIRHANKDPWTKLAWAREEVFAFVIYYKQWTDELSKEEVWVWTRELIDAVLSVDGTYYLPYQLHATQDQFERAYPNFSEFFAIKQQYDPNNRFRNKLWDKYYFTTNL